MDGFDRLWKGSPMTERDVAHIIQETLKAIKDCHTHGICHRDLKPENILINKD
jgi:serine/threonine protein kinase